MFQTTWPGAVTPGFAWQNIIGQEIILKNHNIFMHIKQVCEPG